MELEYDNTDLDISVYENDNERIYRIKENYYNRNLIFKNLNLDLDNTKQNNTMATITITNECAQQIATSLLNDIFEKHKGKKIHDELTIEQALEGLNLEKPKEEKVKEEVKEKKKEKKPRKPSPYNNYTVKGKEEITQKWKELKENDPSIKFLKVAGMLWKEKSTEEKNTYA